MYNRNVKAATTAKPTYKKAATQQDEAPLVGGIWEKKSKKGNDYLSVSINLATLGLGQGFLNLVGFANPQNGNPKTPTYRLVESKPMEGAAAKAVANTDTEETPF